MPKIRGIDYQQLEDANGLVGIGTDQKLSALTVVPPVDFVATGTTSVNASTSLAGISTLFLSEVGIGDRISVSSAPSTFATVIAIASDLALTTDIALGNGTSQTINVKKSIARFGTNNVISDQGFFGLNTQTPKRLLDLNSPTGVPALAIANWDAASWSSNEIRWGGVSSAQWGIATFWTGGTEKLRIDSSGNVGIGQTPRVGFGIGVIGGAWGGATVGIKAEILSGNSSVSNGGNVRILTNDSHAVDFGGSLTFGGNYATTVSAIDFASIAGRKETATGGQTGGYLSLATRPDAGNMTERFRIDSIGNIGVGVTPSYRMHIAQSVVGQADIMVLANLNGAQSDSVAIGLRNTQADFLAKLVGYVGDTGNNGGGFKVQLRNGANGSFYDSMLLKDVSGRVFVGINTVPSFMLDLRDNVNTSGQFLAQFLQPNINSTAFCSIAIGKSQSANQGGSISFLYNSATPSASCLQLGITAVNTAILSVGNNNVAIGTANLTLARLNVVCGTGGNSARFSDNVNSAFWISHPSGGIARLDTDGGNQLQLYSGGAIAAHIFPTGRMIFNNSANLDGNYRWEFDAAAGHGIFIKTTGSNMHSLCLNYAGPVITEACQIKYNNNGTAMYTRVGSIGQMEWINNAYDTVLFSFAQNGSAAKLGGGNWVATSDARLKKDVSDLQDALKVIASFRPVSFEWKEPRNEPTKGFIAQEVEEINSKWVVEDRNGMKQINLTNDFFAYLVGAIKELSDRLDKAGI